MFLGVNNLNMDSKGRIAIPAMYRDDLREICDGELVITLDPTGGKSQRCLVIYPKPQWEVIQEDLVSRPNLRGNVRNKQRLMLGHASPQILDGQGRVTVVPLLREFAGLTKSVVLMGQGPRFELWNEDTYKQSLPQWFDSDDEDETNDEALDSFRI